MNKKLIFYFIFILVSTNIFSIKAVTYEPKTIFVDDIPGEGHDNPSEDFTKIQDAIDNASDGDTIYVYSGVYNENILISKQIKLIGTNKENTIVSATNPTEYLILDTVISTYINNLTFSCSNTERTDIIKMINCSHCEISNINIISNPLQRSALIINGSNNIITQITIEGRFIFAGIELYYTEGNSITNNAINSNGIGILIHRSHNNKITSNSITNNSNGIYLEEGNKNIITKNILKRNNRGIFSSYSTKNVIEKNNFIENVEQAKFTRLLRKGFIHPNNWDNNYWDDYRGYLIKPITGIFYIQNRFLFGLFIPWVEFDWHPAKEPFNIQI